MIEKEQIIRLQSISGCSFVACKKALLLADGVEEIAIEFLRLKYSGVNRKKKENGKLVPWTDRDYLLAAINKEMKK